MFCLYSVMYYRKYFQILSDFYSLTDSKTTFQNSDWINSKSQTSKLSATLTMSQLYIALSPLSLTVSPHLNNLIIGMVVEKPVCVARQRHLSSGEYYHGNGCVSHFLPALFCTPHDKV